MGAAVGEGLQARAVGDGVERGGDAAVSRIPYPPSTDAIIPPACQEVSSGP